MAAIMVFAPHPDDDIIGCGGSIARHVQQGDHVQIVYMTSGEAGSLLFPARELALIREAEARSAANFLGVTDVLFLGNPDGYLEYNQGNLVWIVTALRANKPSIIYLPHSRDAVPDHLNTYRLVVEGCRRAAGPWYQDCGVLPWQVNTILGYEIWTPLETVGYSQDITAQISLKLTALQMHKTQTECIPYHEAIEGLNRYRGVMTGRGKYCECFQLIQANI